MAGKLIVVTPKLDLAFDGRNNATAYTEVVLAREIRMVEWESGVLVVRLHSKASWSGTANADVRVVNIAPAPEEPQTLFAGTTIATQAIANADPAGSLYTMALSTPISSAVRVVFRWWQGLTAAAGPQSIGVGVDLVVRS